MPGLSSHCKWCPGPAKGCAQTDFLTTLSFQHHGALVSSMFIHVAQLFFVVVILHAYHHNYNGMLFSK